MKQESPIIMDGGIPKNESSSESDDDFDMQQSIGELNAYCDDETERDEKTEENENEEEEEDPVIQAIKRNHVLKTNHPKDIVVEDLISEICFHPNENYIALASISGDVLIYDYTSTNEEQTPLFTLEAHEKSCRDIDFSSDGKKIFSCGKDKAIFIHDFETQKLTGMFENAHKRPIYTLCIINQNNFATGDENGTVNLWDLRQRNLKPVFSLKECDDYINGMLANDEEKFLVCTSGDGTLTTFDMRAKKMHCKTEDYPEEFTCLGLFKRGRKIVTCGNKGNMYLFNWGEFGLHTDKILCKNNLSINCMIPITETIGIYGSEDGYIRTQSIFPDKPLGVVGQHEVSVENLDVNNDGSIIASSSGEGPIKFWNVSYLEEINVSERVKGGRKSGMNRNLPSSKIDHAANFFADL
ncbi:hypothetical protein TKK_0013636 [Trichogramma kaykai]